MYLRGICEELTGRALKEFIRCGETVAAKEGYLPARDGRNRIALSRRHAIQACGDSLHRLGVEYIDLYQILRFDAKMPLEETLAALDQLAHDGKVRYLGTTSPYAWQLMKALSVSERNGWARFVSIQHHHNLLDREEEREVLPLCRDEERGVIPWPPQAREWLARTAAKTRVRSTAWAANDEYAHQTYDEDANRDIVDALDLVLTRASECSSRRPIGRSRFSDTKESAS